MRAEIAQQPAVWQQLLQLLALHLAVARGEDTGAPRGLHKVTETT